MIGSRRRGHGLVVSRAGLLSRENGLDAPAARSMVETRVADLVGAHFDFVWRLLRRFGLPAADADDAAQEVFMIAARRLSSIEPDRERAFLYGTARRVLANTRRGVRRRRETGEGEIADESEASSALPDELVALVRARSLLDDLLLELPGELRSALVLAELEGATVPEIAAFEGIPVGTAASRLRRAREAFRALLAARRDQNPFDPGLD